MGNRDGDEITCHALSALRDARRRSDSILLFLGATVFFGL